MNRNRLFLALAALLAGKLSTTPAIAQDVQAVDIASKMTQVVDNLSQKKTGEPVQGEQKVIVRDLDALIASLEKQLENTRNGIKQNRPSRGMADSMIRSGTGGIGDLSDPANGGKDWAKLSERERDRILQSMSEGFPPEYRTVLERYYRRLAEEKSVRAPGDAARAKDSPAPTSPAKP
jgi:hypothetical protein